MPATPEDIDATKGYTLNHLMLRITDPARSLDFYERVLGFRLVTRLDFAPAKFSLYFLQPRGHTDPSDGSVEATFSRQGLLELTHNWGSESDGTTVHSGNSEPRGYGHIGLSVPDIEAACARFESLGVTFQKRLGEGGMKDIAFIRDPDGYWIEIVQPDRLAPLLEPNRV